MGKLKLAAYWAASCGGCDVSILDLDAKILEVAAMCDIVFWPIAVDFKYSNVEAMADGEIDLCLFNGAIRNSEGRHIAEMLRRKSKILVAYGSCAAFGGVPGLANQSSREQVLDTVFADGPSLDNPDGVRPEPSSQRADRTVEIPEFYDAVLPLRAAVDIDYVMPGCPPNWERLWDVLGVIKAWAAGKAELPPKGAVIGAGTKSLCDGCERSKSERLEIERFYRPHEKIPEPDVCLMEQGFVCMGSVTREGCGWRCINADIPCRGCYGPLDGVRDPGARFLSALASQIKATDPDEIERVLDTVADPLGTFYRYGLPSGTIWRSQQS
jgi:F420-non-reducing hydrogenase small subunit